MDNKYGFCYDDEINDKVYNWSYDSDKHRVHKHVYDSKDGELIDHTECDVNGITAEILDYMLSDLNISREYQEKQKRQIKRYENAIKISRDPDKLDLIHKLLNLLIKD